MDKAMDRRYLDELRPLLEKTYGMGRADAIIADAWKRYAEICAENAYEPKKVHMHTRKRIYPACAAFYAMRQAGLTREETADFLNNYYIKRAGAVGAALRKVMKIPGLYRLMPRLFGKMTKSSFGEAAGFRARWYETKKGEMRFDMLVCPYYDKCLRYGCVEIVEGFCRADDVCYGSMHPKLKWGRSKTLGLGGDCCDFNMTIEK